MKVLHLTHVWLETAFRRFQMATLRPMAPFEVVHQLRMRQLHLEDKARRLAL
jgi:hypothetical protein